jgi:uncharacterized protein YegP (UPF0339 family)
MTVARCPSRSPTVAAFETRGWLYRRRVNSTSAGAPTVYFQLYRDTAGYWRWTLFAANGRKIADSGEGYVNKSDAENGINLVKSTNSSTPVRG